MKRKITRQHGLGFYLPEITAWSKAIQTLKEPLTFSSWNKNPTLKRYHITEAIPGESPTQITSRNKQRSTHGFAFPTAE